MNKNFVSYQSNEFATDDDFQQWVFHPNAESNRFWRAFLQQHPEKKPVIEEARAILLHLAQDDELPELPERKEHVWEKIQAELSERETAPLMGGNRLRPLWRMAASVAAVVALVTTFLFWFQSSPVRTYTTGAGEKKTFFLPDSSEVTLNVHSSLRLSEDWNEEQTREVWLEGEGFFHVRKKNARTRFIVHTADLNVEVLGTSFNVRTRSASTQVVLTEGKVKIDPVNQPSQPSIYMAPGESVTVKEKINISKTTVNPALYSAWKSNELVLNRTSLSEIGHFIEENYGLTVVYAQDTLPHLILDGTALPTDNRDNFLKAISTALDIRYTLDGKQITFKNK